MAGAPVPSRVPQSTVLIMSPVAERRFSIGRFLEWELPHLRVLLASSFSDCRVLLRREAIDLLVLDAAHGESPEFDPEAEVPRRVPRIYLADHPHSIAQSSPPDARSAEAPRLDFRVLLNQVKRALRPATRA